MAEQGWVLWYWGATFKGRGEYVRLVFEAAGVPYTENNDGADIMSHCDMQGHKGKGCVSSRSSVDTFHSSRSTACGCCLKTSPPLFHLFSRWPVVIMQGSSFFIMDFCSRLQVSIPSQGETTRTVNLWTSVGHC